MYLRLESLHGLQGGEVARAARRKGYMGYKAETGSHGVINMPCVPSQVHVC